MTQRGLRLSSWLTPVHRCPRHALLLPLLQRRWLSLGWRGFAASALHSLWARRARRRMRQRLPETPPKRPLEVSGRGILLWDLWNVWNDTS